LILKSIYNRYANFLLVSFFYQQQHCVKQIDDTETHGREKKDKNLNYLINRYINDIIFTQFW